MKKYSIDSGYWFPKDNFLGGLVYYLSVDVEDADGNPVELYAEIPVPDYGEEVPNHDWDMAAYSKMEEDIIKQAEAYGIDLEMLDFKDDCMDVIPSFHTIYKNKKNGHLTLPHSGIKNRYEYYIATHREILQAIEEAPTWDAIESGVYDAFCKELKLDYHSFDDPDELFAAMRKVVEKENKMVSELEQTVITRLKEK